MILPILCCGAPKFHLHSQVNLHRSAEIFPKSSGCIIAFYIEIFTFVNRRVGRVLSSPPNYSGQWQYHSRVDFIVTFLSLRFWQCTGAMLGNWYRNDLFDTDLTQSLTLTLEGFALYLVLPLPNCVCNIRVSQSVSGLIIYCDRKWSGEMFHHSIRCPKETPMAIAVSQPRTEEGVLPFTFQRCFCRFFRVPLSLLKPEPSKLASVKGARSASSAEEACSSHSAGAEAASAATQCPVFKNGSSFVGPSCDRKLDCRGGWKLDYFQLSLR